jgi:hypothetical protein
VPNQTTNESLFYTWNEWLNDGKEFFKTGQLESMLSLQ